MNKTTWTLVALLVGGMSVGTMTSRAAEYEDATKVKTESTVTIVENDSPDAVIPDPDDPSKEVVPESPVNPNPGQLRINYVSNFDFGKIKNTSGEIVQSARLDQLWSDGSEEGRVPFVATEDRRGNERLGWELQVAQPEQLTDDTGHELKGATITFSGLRYSSTSDATPVANQNTLVLGEAAQTLATADAQQGAGAWSLALGNADTSGTTDGVVLRIPANTTKNNNTVYSTSLVWELVADPTTGIGE